MDVELLSRIQFALTAGFHFLYPPISIGMGLILVILEFMYVRTGNILWKNVTKFWVKLFALTFAVGVATGVVLEFEFGTNWKDILVSLVTYLAVLWQLKVFFHSFLNPHFLV